LENNKKQQKKRWGICGDAFTFHVGWLVQMVKIQFSIPFMDGFGDHGKRAAYHLGTRFNQ